MVFILLALWWIKIRSLWKLPDGKSPRAQMNLVHPRTQRLHRDWARTVWVSQSQTSWKVKWAFRSITMNKARGGDWIPVELFQILKYDAVKVLHSIYQQSWKTQQWPQNWKRTVFIPIQKNANAKECSNYHTIALISQTSKVMFKILHAKLQ